MNKEQASKLYNFIFHVGISGDIEVVTRNNYFDLGNNRTKVLIFSDFDTAVDMLLRTGGDKEKIEELINKKS